MTIQIGSTRCQREFFFTEILALGPTVSREAQFNRISDLSLESIGTVGMAIEEIAGLTDLEWVRSYQH